MEDELLEIMKQKFPLHRNRIEYLYRENEDFRVLCEDYHTCMQSLRKFRKSISESESGLSDFEAAISDLEKELYHFIF